MVFDLRGALLKKEEMESARLMDFEFRLRARTMRLLGGKLGLELVGEVAKGDDDAIIAGLRERFPGVASDFALCREEARKQLIAEHGDPTPYKLA